MSAELLLQHFERISEAPDAIVRLRRFILDLAIRGKLVAQDANDEPAAELLKRIYARKATTKKVAPKTERQDLMFELPSGWCSASFGDVFSLEYGDNLPAEKRSNSGEFPVYGSNGVVGSHLQCFVRSPCIVVGRKGSAGALNLSLAQGCCVTDVAYYCVPPKEIDLLFAFKMFHTLRLEDLGKGVKPGLNRSDAYALAIAIPPIAEQRRIATKVDELMALCDQLEAAKGECEQSRDQLVRATLQRLSQPNDEESFGEHAGFALSNLARLTGRAERIKQLRQTILNLAVRGKLVTQDVRDKPAPKFDVAQKAAGRDRIKMSLPTGWSWAKVEDVADARLGKMLDKAKNSGQPYRYLRNTNVHWFDVRFDELKSLRLEPSEVEKYLLRDGDVLICEGGHGIGRTAVWREQEPNVVFQKALHRVRPGHLLASDFFAMCVSVYFDAGVLQNYFTGVGIPHFTGKALSKLVFPLPPIAEQHRIVAKVAALITLCGQLEAELTSTEADSGRLLEAVLHEALTAPALAAVA